MTILFLTPPFRRPYELSYFCSFSEDVIIVIDKDTFCKYADSFEEFKQFNFHFFFLSIEIEMISKILKLGSTAALISYNEAHLSRIVRDSKVRVIVSVEIFSSLSTQASRLASKFSLRHIVIVWENIKKSIFYFIPPFSINTKIVKSSANKFIAVSNMSKQSITSLHVDEGKIEIIYPGIFVDKFKPSIDSTDKILFVGELEPNKGISVLLNAFEKLSHYLFDTVLVIVGRGSLENKVIKLKNSGLKVDYRGYIPHSTLATVYSDCSVFCSPSVKVKRAGLILTLQEQFGFTLVEAMASGLPVVSSNVGTIPEIVGTENLVVSPDTDNVFTALHKLLTCDELRKGLRKKNRERSLSRFNTPTQSRLFERRISV